MAPSPAKLSISPTAFDGVDKTTCKIVVPVGSESAYKSVTAFERFTIEASSTSTVTTALHDFERIDTVVISPNPTHDFVTVTLSSQQAFTVEMVDLLGRVLTIQSGLGSLKLDCSGFGAGVYVVKVQSGGFVTTKRLVVE
jgi:hypothetical protein